MYLATTPDGNALLEQDGLALLIGMLLDQQVPMEKAFTSPFVLRERMGRDLDATEIAEYDPAAFEELFRTLSVPAGARTLPEPGTVPFDVEAVMAEQTRLGTRVVGPPMGPEDVR